MRVVGAAPRATVLGLLALTACGPEPLPVLGVVPPFTLTAQDDTVVTAESLRGRVWVVNFIFTRCPDICPALTQQMRRVRRALPSGARGVLAVSISVDPVHDQPAVLREYAQQHGAAGADWLLLTGPAPVVRSLVRDGFRLGLSDEGPPGQPIVHSDRFVLVDGALRVRGYYRGMEADAVDRLIADAQALLAPGGHEASGG